jgi:riboflavin synthase
MFTGIIEEIGFISSLVKIGDNQLELSVFCKQMQADIKLGDSVAVSGVCLTVVRYDQSQVTFELSSETMNSTTFSRQLSGNAVNLERALRLSDRLGGHIVQGHVDSVAQIRGIKKRGGFYEFDFSLPIEIRNYVVKKGSIAIDGVSLTIADLKEEWFRIAVIPHTFEQTILRLKKPGDSVHIETDILARYIERLLVDDKTDLKTGGITAEFLKSHGF